MTTDLNLLLEKQQNAFYREGKVEAGTRIDRIDRAIALLVDHQDKICKAIDEDFGSRSRHVSLMTDLYPSVMALKHNKKHLKKWMKPQRRKVMVPLNLFGAKAAVQYEPKGVVGLMTPWNVPVNMIFTPLANILAAGNRCMIKPSEFTPVTSQLMEELIGKYFDDTELAVVNGDVETGIAFSKLPFDHLIFTGATGVGKSILHAAAENMTPVTLELGGKSPVVISDQVNLADAIGKLYAGKTMNAGQLCVAPDYCFIPESLLEASISAFRENAGQMFPTLLNNPDWVNMINERHYERIKAMIDDAEGKCDRLVELNPGNDNWREQTGKIPLHLVINPTDDSLVMQSEIFGPVLAIKTYRELDDVIRFINQQPKALAMYYFGQNKEECDELLGRTSAGGVTINDVAMHVSCEDLPFGGIGGSGMGNYHGFDGFRTFSHHKAIFRQGFVNLAKLANTLPPYGESVDKMMKQQIKK